MLEAKKAAPISSPAAIPPNAAAGVPRNANPVDGGMPVTVGDTYDKISTAYQTYQQPKPWSEGSKELWVYLKDKGIEFFFDNSEAITSIHFVDSLGRKH